jgi:hypothetical protein
MMIFVLFLALGLTAPNDKTYADSVTVKAQCKGPQDCPPGYDCVNGECIYIDKRLHK